MNQNNSNREGKPTASFVGGLAASPGPAQGSVLHDGQQQAPVKDITTAQFMSEVIEASRDRPVLIDFWAPWCGPCRQLAPALEKAVAATRGKVKLVKMNIDQNPEIPGQMGVQSIPAVVAFVDGRPKDAFMGALPETEIKRFIDKLIGAQGPSPIDEALLQAEQFAGQGAISEAANLYASVLEQEPDRIEAIAGMGVLYLESGDLERAKAMLNVIPPEGAAHAKAVALKAAIDLAEQASSLGEAGPLLNRIEADPKDYQARFDLAIVYNAAGNREEAADQLLEVILRDRTWRDDGARNQLLQFFEAWGPLDPATVSARRRLSSLLFS
jgi:putative thioredoxin